MEKCLFSAILVITVLFFFFFEREIKRGKEGERETEKHRGERETSIGAPSRDRTLQPRHMPQLGIDPTTFGLSDDDHRVPQTRARPQRSAYLNYQDHQTVKPCGFFLFLLHGPVHHCSFIISLTRICGFKKYIPPLPHWTCHSLRPYILSFQTSCLNTMSNTCVLCQHLLN